MRRRGAADARLVRRSAVRIGVQVAGISAGLVLAVYVMVVGFVWLQSRRLEALEPHPGDIRFAIDPADFVAALLLLGGFSILLAGVATWLIARRATAPIEEALEVQRAFVADASHELRTPLAVASTRLQRLERVIEDAERRAEVLAALRTDMRAISSIVDELLVAAGNDERGPVERRADLGAALAAAVAAVEPLADAARVDIDVDRQSVQVRMPAEDLRRALTMILDDAVAHPGPGGVIRATVRPGLTHASVDVTGVVPDLAPDRILARFAHHPATAPEGHGSTTGLGLALASDLSARYRADVRLLGAGASPSIRLRVPRFPTRNDLVDVVFGRRGRRGRLL